MKNNKTTIITIETWRSTVLRRRQVQTFWCEHCSAQVAMLSPAQAAHLTGATERAIFRRIENGDIDFIETPEGNLLICSASLLGEKRASYVG
jgi:hypothetical protein